MRIKIIFTALILINTFSFVGCKKKESLKTLETITQNISASDGGDISLSDVATVTISNETFANDVSVTLSQTNSTTTQKDFNLIGMLFGVKDQLPYEIRINTGKSEPVKDIKVVVSLPDDFIAKTSSDYGMQVFGQLYTDDGEEADDNFEIISSEYYNSRKSLEIVLPAYYFTNVRTSDGTFEAVLKVANCPGPNFSLGRISGEECGMYINCPTLSCSVTSPFNPNRIHPITHKPTPHRGVDFSASVGTNVMCASDGTIIASGFQFNSTTKTGWGNFIIVEHKNTAGQRFATLYAHLDRIIKKSGTVKEGDIIGLSGKTGGVSGPHLHFEYVLNANIADKSARVDPMPYINTTSPRLISAKAACTSINTCDITTSVKGSPWNVIFDYRDPRNLITSEATLTFQSVDPIRSPWTVSIGSILSGGVVNSPTFCAYFRDISYFKIKVYLTLPNGEQSNCINFFLNKPAGANRLYDNNNISYPEPSPFSIK